MRDALFGQREALGSAHPATLTTLANLAVMRHAAGDLREARTLAEEALRGMVDALGKTQSDTLTVANNLASARARHSRRVRTRMR